MPPSIMGDSVQHALHQQEQLPTICNIQFSFPQNTNANLVVLSADLHLKLFPSTQTTSTNIAPNYISINPIGSNIHTEYKCFKVASPDNTLPQDTVVLVNHEEYRDTTIDKCHIVTAYPVTLSKVIISAPVEIYKILHSMSSCNCKQTVLSLLGDDMVKMGDFIKCFNSVVVMCEPINQGTVSATTEIVIVKSEHSHQLVCSTVTPPPEATLDYGEIVAAASLNNGLVTTVQQQKKKKKKKSVDLEVAPIQREMYAMMMGGGIVPTGTDDTTIAFVSTSNLIKLACFNGTLVQVKSHSDSRYVRVHTLYEPNDLDPNTIYVSPITIHNMSTPTTLTLSKVTNKQFPVAHKVTLARVSSPITLDKTYQNVLLTHLKTYFETATRIVKHGDLIPVTIDTVLAKTLFETFGDAGFPEIIPQGVGDAVAWFQVTDIDNETDEFIIDASRTVSTQSGVVSLKHPPNAQLGWYQYLNLPSMFHYNKTGFKYHQELCKLIHTSQSSPQPLKPIILLTSNHRKAGKSTVIHHVAYNMGIPLLELDCLDLVNSNEAKVIGTIRGKVDKLVQSCRDGFILYLSHIECVCPVGANAVSLKMALTFHEYLNNSKMVIILSCNDVEKLNDSIRNVIKFEIDVGIPTEDERIEIFQYYLSSLQGNNNNETSYKIRSDVSYKTLAIQSAGLTPMDIHTIIQTTKKNSYSHLYKLAQTYQTSLQNLIYCSGGHIPITPYDFESAINTARDKASDSIGAPKIPSVKWEDIGGLDLVKGEILDTIDMPLKHPELFSTGIKKRSGILFYGPPGTGKTLLAKAIATEFSLNFFSVKGPELLNMYIGESEANVRKVFQRARDAKPCVVFFDELDSVAPKRGNQGDSGGVMDRIVSQLLAELDGMSGGGGDGVFVVGATNRPDLLDEALLRPGRFDKLLYLGISDTDEKQYKILEALTRKFQLSPKIDLMEIAQRCTYNYTGADFYALCSDSMLNAMTRTANLVDIKVKEYGEAQGKSVSSRWWFDNVATEQDIAVVVEVEDFHKAVDALTPSVSADELAHYMRVRDNFEN